MSEVHPRSLMRVISQTVIEAGSRPILAYLYGPMAAHNRRAIVSKMHGGEQIRVNDKRVQWGNFRKALLTLAGILPETCTADGDARFQDMVDRLFPTPSAENRHRQEEVAVAMFKRLSEDADAAIKAAGGVEVARIQDEVVYNMPESK
jgi:hypothetical protein